MRAITKGAEPRRLTAHRKTAHCDYDNYHNKDALRRSLVTEQRGICCYCMRRIHNGPTTMKIEHWHCQSHFLREQLAYRNLLGACLGGDGQPSHLQHCDTHKRDRNLQWNPADPTHHIETRIRYEMDGSIRSDEPAFNSQLDEVLNLNIGFLKNNRKAVWVGITEWWEMEKARFHGPVARARVQAERNRRIAGNGELEPFCQVAIWWLDQRIANTAP
jgi:uncharacterized protein (TIGR02646 family)